MSLARRVFASLRVPAYRRFFAGHVVSLLGFWVRIVVQGWLVYILTDSEVMLGTVTAIGLLPFVVLSPLGGLLADRVDRRRMLFTLPIVSVLANIALGVLVLTGSVTVGYVIAAAVAIGGARALEIPVRNAFVRDLVGVADLRNAIALNAAGFNVARVLGPAIGAGLLPILGMGPCFFVAAAANLTMIVALLGLSVPRATARAAGAGPWEQIVESLRYVRGHRRTRTLIILLAITLICTWTYQPLMPAFAKDRLGMQEEGYSLLMVVIGAGALLGALWVASRAGGRPIRRNLLFGLLWAGALSLFLLGFVQHPVPSLPLLFVLGFCQVGFMATAIGMVQESVPDELRGRVMGLWAFTFGACYPVGCLLMGWASQEFGIHVAWSGGAVLMVLLSGLVRLYMPRRSAAKAEADARRVASAPPTADGGPGLGGPIA